MSESVVLQALDGLGWAIEGGKLRKRWSFDDFAQAKALVDRVSELAQAHNHHPDVEFGWGYVALSLHSHDVGGLTRRDVRLVKAIEAQG